MGIREVMLDTESEKGKRFYVKMLSWLDSPARKLFDKPEKLVQSSGIKAGQTVLEIGCGSGFFTIPAAKILGENGKLYSTDIHSIAIEQMREKVKMAGVKNVVVKQDNAMDSTFDDGMFDLILLYGVVPAPVISMKDISMEIHRLLKPGGVCAIWTKTPFWTPKTAIQYAEFETMKKCNGVFRLRKR